MQNRPRCSRGLTLVSSISQRGNGDVIVVFRAVSKATSNADRLVYIEEDYESEPLSLFWRLGASPFGPRWNLSMRERRPRLG